MHYMMTTMKAYACNTVKFTKTNPNKISNRGRAGPGSAFDDHLTKIFEAANIGQVVQVTY